MTSWTHARQEVVWSSLEGRLRARARTHRTLRGCAVVALASALAMFWLSVGNKASGASVNPEASSALLGDAGLRAD